MLFLLYCCYIALLLLLLTAQTRNCLVIAAAYGLHVGLPLRRSTGLGCTSVCGSSQGVVLLLLMAASMLI